MYTNELYHHGIAGQKWGVQNGPPYPLDSKTHQSVIKKAGSTVKKAADATKDTVAKIQKKAEDDKEVRAKKKAAKIAEKKAKIDERDQKLKDEIMKSGDLKAAAKNYKLFSNDEIAKIIERHAVVTNLESLTDHKKAAQEENKKEGLADKINNKADQINNKANQINQNNANGVDKSQEIINKIKKTGDTIGAVSNAMGNVKNLAENSIGTYNAVAKVANANGQNWKIIGESAPKIDTTTTKEFRDGFMEKETVTKKTGKDTETIINHRTNPNKDNSAANNTTSTESTNKEKSENSSSNNKSSMDDIINGVFKEVFKDSNHAEQKAASVLLSQSSNWLLEDLQKKNK